MFAKLNENFVIGEKTMHNIIIEMSGSILLSMAFSSLILDNQLREFERMLTFLFGFVRFPDHQFSASTLFAGVVVVVFPHAVFSTKELRH